jgi:hypothetical protein
MSHIVTIQTVVRDVAAIRAACNRLGLPPPTERTVQLFEGTARGLTVEFPGWKYPLVCDVASGTVRYDIYEGVWGDPQHLDRFLQIYAAEKARLEAHRRGHTVTEQPLADGSLRLTIHVAGGLP